MPEETQMPTADMPMPESAQTPPMPQGGGSVMISLPESEFMAMREIISQLASVMDQLAQSVMEQEQTQNAPVAPTEVSPSEEDMAFLNGLAQEGSMR